MVDNPYTFYYPDGINAWLFVSRNAAATADINDRNFYIKLIVKKRAFVIAARFLRKLCEAGYVTAVSRREKNRVALPGNALAEWRRYRNFLPKENQALVFAFNNYFNVTGLADKIGVQEK
jgi:hypothetical protein